MLNSVELFSAIYSIYASEHYWMCKRAATQSTAHANNEGFGWQASVAKPAI